MKWKQREQEIGDNTKRGHTKMRKHKLSKQNKTKTMQNTNCHKVQTRRDTKGRRLKVEG